MKKNIGTETVATPANTCAICALLAFREDLAEGLANLVTFYNPSVIVLGGGISQSPELFEALPLFPDVVTLNKQRGSTARGNSLYEQVNLKTLPATRGKCKVVAGSLGSDAGAMGAAWLAMNSLAQERPRKIPKRATE